MANIAAQASKHRMSCRSSSFGRRYLNSRYNSVSELLIVVPERKVAPKSLARALLYGAYGKEHVQCLLASLAVAQSRHTVMARVERQIFELVRFINEDVVDAHLLEIHHVVRA